MKNKHLILIFLTTLLLGLAAKYLPWFKSEIIKTRLIEIRPEELQKISIQTPGHSELLLERSDDYWVASQDDLVVRTADSTILPILAAFINVYSIRIINSDRPDTLGFYPSNTILVEATTRKGRKETLRIGHETIENKHNATYASLGEHQGIYLVDKHLRNVFNKSMDDFRSKNVLKLSEQNLSRILLERVGRDTFQCFKLDTLDFWGSNRDDKFIAPSQLTNWLKSLHALNGAQFANNFDENDNQYSLAGKLELEYQNTEEQFWVNIYQRGNGMTRKYPFVLQCSQNPFNYFEVSDTSLVNRIFAGPATTGHD